MGNIDPIPSPRQAAEVAGLHGGLAGFAYRADEDRVLTARITSKRRGPAHVRYEVLLQSNVGDAETTIFYDLESPFPVDVPERADVALLVAFFPALHHGGTLRIEGVVSPRLIRNVLDLQSIWIRARPDRYRPFRVDVEGVSRAVPTGASQQAVMPLSGGLDSTLTLCRHTDPERPLGEATVDVGACLFLPGLSPRSDRRAEFPAAIETVRRLAATRGLPLVVAETNFSNVVRWGEDAHGALLAAGLTLLSPHFRMGLLGSSVPHSLRSIPVWGSAPQIDPFFSSDGFEIRDDGGDMLRVEKVAAMTHYPDMLDRLVVCFELTGLTGNCCRCEKCTRTMIAFLAVGAEIPKGAFPKGLDLDRVRKRLRGQLAFAQPTLEMAQANGIDHPAIRRLRRHYRIHLAKYGARYAITRLLPFVDLLQRDGFPPGWLIRRRARAVQRAGRGLSWRT